MSALDCVAGEIYSFVRPEVLKGNISPISFDEIRDSLFGAGGYHADVHGAAASYLRLVDMGAYCQITSLATDPLAEGIGLEEYLVKSAVEDSNGKPVVAVVCNANKEPFLCNGFKEMNRALVPEKLMDKKTKQKLDSLEHIIVLLGKNPFKNPTR